MHPVSKPALLPQIRLIDNSSPLLLLLSSMKLLTSPHTYITNIIQMHILECAMLRRESAIFALRYAMATIKLHSALPSPLPPHAHVSFRDGEFLSQQTGQGHPASASSHTIQLQNKELYLRYVEEVLSGKEQELVQLEEHLAQRRTLLDEQEGQLRLAAPLVLAQQAEMLGKKAGALREVAFRVASSRNQAAVVRELEEFQSSLAAIEKGCRREQEAAGAELKHAMAELASEREQLAAARSKLGELQSYERYLSDLQAALEQKEYQVIMKEREIQQLSLAFGSSSNAQTLSLKQDNEQFNTYQEDSHPNQDQSIRKRAKIFEPRPSQTELGQHRESSKIMQENSTNDYTKQKSSKASEEPHPHFHTHAPSHSLPLPPLVSAAVQTSCEYPLPSACLRLQGEQAMVKFMRLWTKWSLGSDRGGTNHTKTMALYRWRLNAVFSEQARRKIQQAICWPKRVPLPSDYQDLSLKKRKYFQKFYEHQRKMFHREKTLVRLRAVLKNRNRRQRTAVLLSFQRYRNNARMMSLMSLFQGSNTPALFTDRALQEKPCNPLPQTKPKTASRSDSRILGSATSNDTRINSDGSKTKLRQTPSSSTVSKSRIGQKDQAAIDIPKLKEYIKNQEETEAKLATQCARTESAFRTFMLLSGVLSRLRTRFMVNSMRIGETGKLNGLERAMGSCEFKWELFMAKARLALTTNTNKVAHLEQLIGFIEPK